MPQISFDQLSKLNIHLGAVAVWLENQVAADHDSPLGRVKAHAQAATDTLSEVIAAIPIPEIPKEAEDGNRPGAVQQTEETT